MKWRKLKETRRAILQMKSTQQAQNAFNRVDKVVFGMISAAFLAGIASKAKHANQVDP